MRTLGLGFSVLLLSCVGDVPSGGDSGPTDSGGDAPGAPDTGAQDTGLLDGSDTWCKVNHPSATLCDDFDLGTTFKPAWSASGSGLLVVGPPFKSPPRSLQSTASSNQASTLNFTTATAQTSSTSIEADIQVAQDGVMATGGASPGLMLLVGENNAPTRVALVLLPGPDSRGPAAPSAAWT